jgi:transposase
MQGQKYFHDKVSTHFRLSERVPEHNFYRRLRDVLDWEFLRAQTRPVYSHTGQPSLDPVVFFKLVLVGRLENIVSDRRLIEQCALRLDILYFLGYEVDEDLPWHSTISRTRQLYPAAVFEHLFNQVFAQCVVAGLVAGDTQVVDSAPVKAAASLDSLREKPASVAPPLTIAGEQVAAEPAAPVTRSAPAHQLRREATRRAKRQAAPGGLGARHPKAQILSNKTHYSPTDPDARISVKPGKARALNYLCSVAVDTASGIISHIQADFADRRDSTYVPELVPRLQSRLAANELVMRDFVADTGYSNGFNYAFLEQRSITPWIPVFGAYKPAAAGFTYEAEADAFRCPAGKLLSFRNYATTQDGNWVKNYRAAYQDCQQCPLKMSCTPSAPQQKFVRSAFDAAYRRAWHRQHSRAGQRMRRVRQRTVEPVFGSLLHHYGLRRVGTKGQAAAHKAMLLSAIAYNLKKLLKHQPKQTTCVALALYPPPQGRCTLRFSTWLTSFKLRRVRLLAKPTPSLSSATATTVYSM